MTNPPDSPNPPVIIAIDGPAAAGKGTLARKIAEHYDFAYLDTGKLYRLVAYNLLQDKIHLTPQQATLKANEIAKQIPFETMHNPTLDSDEVSKTASIIAKFPETRKALIKLQQDFANNPYIPNNNQKEYKKGAVIDGRDIATVICPNAHVKLYITATPEIRAQRRMDDLAQADYKQILNNIKKRDLEDSQRKHAPLTKANDATTIDTTNLSINEALNACLNEIKNKLNP